MAIFKNLENMKKNMYPNGKKGPGPFLTFLSKLLNKKMCCDINKTKKEDYYDTS